MNTGNMLDPLLKHINRYVVLDPGEEERIRQHVHVRDVKNREQILESGQVCKANYFVMKGCFRMYTTTHSGTEQIVQFGIDNWWITDYTSYDSQKPTSFNIQALESGTIAIMERQAQDQLFIEVPKLERYFRLVLQRAYAATLMRVHFIFSQSGEERYRHFNALFPDFVQRIPQYMLASYLGFTPEFLSKIRAKKA